MNINRDNYEAFFLDYAEGNLSSREEEMLHRFLKFNPDLEEELRSFRLEPVPDEQITFPGKETLKMLFPGMSDPVSKANIGSWCVAYLENDLKEPERAVFEKYLEENPASVVELNKYKAVFLQKEQMVFPGKERLKHRVPMVFDWRYLLPMAAAAAVILFVIFSPAVQPEPVEVASVIETKEREEKDIKEESVNHSPQPGTLKVIRNHRSPVPVSTYKKDDQEEHIDPESGKEEVQPAGEKTVRIAGLDRSQLTLSNIPAGNDQLRPVAVTPPTVNNSSLSLIDLARYQFQRASVMMEDEEVFLWSLASNGLKELNKIRGTDAELLASRDEEGAISGIQFRSRFLNVVAPINREENH
ncbi:MAG: hypothetical protein WD578_01235 [Bacteroidales bacterium]